MISCPSKNMLLVKLFGFIFYLKNPQLSPKVLVNGSYQEYKLCSFCILLTYINPNTGNSDFFHLVKTVKRMSVRASTMRIIGPNSFQIYTFVKFAIK